MTHFVWQVDGCIVGVYLLIAMIAGILVRKYVGKVEDFIVAGRELNVYLGIASLAATEFGIVTFMYAAQSGYRYGFAGATPGILLALAMYIVGRTGFCIKPLRDSGVMTIPELFEKHFDKRVRWVSGVVMVLGGLLNMGVFLRIGGEFLVLVAGLNVQHLEIAMTLLLILVAAYTILGGMISVLVTDFLQFVVMSIGLIAVTILILVKIHWGTLLETVNSRYGPGGFNPFVNKEMGWPYVLFFALLSLAVVLTWQTTIARLLAAKDTKTGQKVYTGTSFFFVCRFFIPVLWGVAALTMVKPAAYMSLSPEMQSQASLYGMPLFLGMFVPMGLMGLLIAGMLAADMSTDSGYMLCWSGIIYNDIIMPLRKTKMSNKHGLLLNRIIVAAIGLFLLFFGLWYKLEGDLVAYVGVTAAIYLSSMSVLLVSCCYWKRSNNWGACAAIITGAIIPILFLVLEKLPPTREMTRNIGPYYAGIAAYVFSAIAMVAGSLLKPKSL